MAGVKILIASCPLSAQIEISLPKNLPARE